MGDLWDGDRQRVPLDFGYQTSRSSSFGPPYSQPSTVRTISDHAPSPASPSVPADLIGGPDILQGIDPGPAEHLSFDSSSIVNGPSMIMTSPTPPPNTQTSFDGHSEHLQEFHSGIDTTASDQVGISPWQNIQVSRAPCPFLSFLEAQGATLNQEQVQALEMVRHTGVSDVLASFIPIYHQAKAQRIPTAPPSVHSSISNSTVTGLPGYACPGLDRPHPATETRTGRYACPMCGHRSDRKNDIFKHMTLRNSAVGYRCPHGNCCRRRARHFTRKHKYVDHLKKHTGAPRDEASVKRAQIPLFQHYPQTCLHCSEPMSSWDHWYDHWLDMHNDQSGNDVLPNHWPRSAVQQQTSHPNLAVSAAQIRSAPRLEDSNLHRWQTYPNSLERMYVQGTSFPRQEAQQAMQDVEQQFFVVE